MTSQANITNYFNARKRLASDQIKARTKILILEAEKSLQKSVASSPNQKDATTSVVFQDSKKIIKSVTKSNKKTAKTAPPLTGTLKQLLLTDFAKKVPEKSEVPGDEVETPIAVAGPSTLERTPIKASKTVPELEANATKSPGLKTPASMTVEEIKAKLRKNPKAAALKASLARFSKLNESLKQLEEKDEQLKLQHFGNDIVVEVPLSPRRAVPFASPKKEAQLLPSHRLSPNRALGSRLAAWQQLSALAEARTPVLPLPLKFKGLLEKFKAVDIVASLMVNRGEEVTFAKLQPGVEEMTRLNFTLHNVAQIKFLYPEAFNLKQEKRKTLALTGRKDVYDLCMEPTFEMKESEGGHKKIASGVLQQRSTQFQSLLIEKIKDCHEVFLKHLDPLLEVCRDKLTRWHPEFDLDQVLDIPAADIPLPPTNEHVSSAKEVLERARDMINCNRRVARALYAASSAEKDKEDDTAPLAEPLNPALRGIPTSLLEKIRAKQAAKALEAMTRTPAQDVHKLRLAKLPDLARILRNVFITEKRSVLSLETIQDRMATSYPHKLTSVEMEEHLMLLAQEEPQLLQKLSVRQATYFKLDRYLNMAEVGARLEVHLKTA